VLEVVPNGIEADPSDQLRQPRIGEPANTGDARETAAAQPFEDFAGDHLNRLLRPAARQFAGEAGDGVEIRRWLIQNAFPRRSATPRSIQLACGAVSAQSGK
jgi:hypothetical protein